MISDLDAVNAAAALYAPNPGDFDRIEETGGVVWGFKAYADCDLVVFRGTMAKEDWFRDILAALGAPPQNGITNLGYLPLGFELGLQEAMRVWGPLCTKPPILVGHSLGAARAAISAGLAKWLGLHIARVVLFACPRPGGMTLQNYLADVPVVNYRNLSDPVCDLPTLPPWSHVRPYTALSAPAAGGDISLFRDHHIELYRAGIAGLLESKT